MILLDHTPEFRDQQAQLAQQYERQSWLERFRFEQASLDLVRRAQLQAGSADSEKPID